MGLDLSSVPRTALRQVPIGVSRRHTNHRNYRRVDCARGHSPCGSPATSVFRKSRRTRASIPGAISSALGTLGPSPLRPRAPRPERLLLWITHQGLAVQLRLLFLALAYSYLRIEFHSPRPL